MPTTSPPTLHRRFPTREVKIGDLRVGAHHPILIQSMTIADTMDTDAVCAEVRRLVDAGCPLVRITAPSQREAENLRVIRKRLRADGIHVPLVADIHFTPNAALVAADVVEKVRVNPGNFADRKRFRVFEISDDEYRRELDRIRERFVPLVRRLAANGAALRIGTNHGSLSDRIMNRYGDTPDGMVESALEFVRMCEDEGYHQIVLSMKSSIPSVMIAAYRLLVRKMIAEGMNYPIHIGVTEAGDGLDGRVKSAIGIGSLLASGIGDTIRVSLTEDAHHEIGAAENILDAIEREVTADHTDVATDPTPWTLLSTDPAHTRRPVPEVSLGTLLIGDDHPVRIETEAPLAFRRGDGLTARFPDDAAVRRMIRSIGHDEGAELLTVSPEWSDAAADEVDAVADALGGDAFEAMALIGATRPPMLLDWGERPLPPAAVRALATIVSGHAVATGPGDEAWPALREADAFLRVGVTTLPEAEAVIARARDEGVRIGVSVEGSPHRIERMREIVTAPVAEGVPVFLRLPAGGAMHAVCGGSVLHEGIGDVVCLTRRASPPTAPWPPGGVPWTDEPVEGAYRLLQACRVRHTRAEFIACPSCGRTQFDLQTTTARIRARTAHLKGVKIAIMGCIVNGPGEMADADFGYVGSGVKKIDLYVGKTRVEKNIPEAMAEEKLVDLLREHGAWIDPPVKSEAGA